MGSSQGFHYWQLLGASQWLYVGISPFQPFVNILCPGPSLSLTSTQTITSPLGGASWWPEWPRCLYYFTSLPDAPTFLKQKKSPNIYYMINFDKHPSIRFLWVQRGRPRQQTSNLIFGRLLYSINVQHLRVAKPYTFERKNGVVASSVLGSTPLWSAMQSCFGLINPLRSILTLVSNDGGAHRSHLEWEKLDG